MQHTRLETYYQRRVVVVVDAVVGDVVVVVIVVFVGVNSPVPGVRARRLHDSTPRDDVGPMNPVVTQSGPPSCRSRHEGRRRSRYFDRSSLSTRQ